MLASKRYWPLSKHRMSPMIAESGHRTLSKNLAHQRNSKTPGVTVSKIFRMVPQAEIHFNTEMLNFSFFSGCFFGLMGFTPRTPGGLMGHAGSASTRRKKWKVYGLFRIFRAVWNAIIYGCSRPRAETGVTIDAGSRCKHGSVRMRVRRILFD